MRPTAVLCLIVLLAIVQSPGVAADTGEAVVVDRISDGQAVLLVEIDGEAADQRAVALDELPTDGRHEGAVLQVVDGGYVSDGSATERRTSKARERFDRLAERGGTSGGSRVGTCCLGVYVRRW